MKTRWTGVFAAFAVVVIGAAACDKKGDDENVTADTMAVQGQDTVNLPTAVPVTDTVVKTTTVTTDTEHVKADKDTIKH